VSVKRQLGTVFPWLSVHAARIGWIAFTICLVGVVLAGFGPEEVGVGLAIGGGVTSAIMLLTDGGIVETIPPGADLSTLPLDGGGS
jgi:hypothetical protein